MFDPVGKILKKKNGLFKDLKSYNMTQEDFEAHVGAKNEWGFRSATPEKTGKAKHGKQVAIEQHKEAKLPVGVIRHPSDADLPPGHQVWKTRWYDKNSELSPEELEVKKAFLLGHSQGKVGSSYFITGVTNPHPAGRGSKGRKKSTAW